MTQILSGGVLGCNLLVQAGSRNNYWLAMGSHSIKGLHCFVIVSISSLSLKFLVSVCNLTDDS